MAEHFDNAFIWPLPTLHSPLESNLGAQIQNAIINATTDNTYMSVFGLLGCRLGGPFRRPAVMVDSGIIIIIRNYYGSGRFERDSV